MRNNIFTLALVAATLFAVPLKAGIFETARKIAVHDKEILIKNAKIQKEKFIQDYIDPINNMPITLKLVLGTLGTATGLFSLGFAYSIKKAMNKQGHKDPSDFITPLLTTGFCAYGISSLLIGTGLIALGIRDIRSL